MTAIRHAAGRGPAAPDRLPAGPRPSAERSRGIRAHRTRRRDQAGLFRRAGNRLRSRRPVVGRPGRGRMGGRSPLLVRGHPHRGRTPRQPRNRRSLTSRRAGAAMQSPLTASCWVRLVVSENARRTAQCAPVPSLPFTGPSLSSMLRASEPAPHQCAPGGGSRWPVSSDAGGVRPCRVSWDDCRHEDRGDSLAGSPGVLAVIASSWIFEEVRWRAAGHHRSRSFMNWALADGYRADLVRAAHRGTGFEPGHR